MKNPHAEPIRIALEKVQEITQRYLVPDGITAEQAMTEILALTDQPELVAHQIAFLNHAEQRAKLVLDLTGGCMNNLSCNVPIDLLLISFDTDDIADAVPPEKMVGALHMQSDDMLLINGEGEAFAAKLQIDAGHGTGQDAIDTFALVKR